MTGFIHDYDGWSFVGCPSRLGSIKKVGPVTGSEWSIKPTGEWIDANDAAELVEIIEPVWCFRANGFIQVKTVFYLNPDIDQMTRRPNA